MAYTVESRKNAFRLFRMFGDISKVSRATGISTDTLHKWKKEDNWEEGVEKVVTAVQGLYALQEEAEASLVARDELKMLGLCDYLQLEALDALIADPSCRPKSFKDVVEALKFVRDTKEMILSGKKKPPDGSKDSLQELSDAELDKIIASAAGELKERNVISPAGGNGVPVDA